MYENNFTSLKIKDAAPDIYLQNFVLKIISVNYVQRYLMKIHG